MGFDLFEGLFGVAFVAVAALFVLTLVRGLNEKRKDDNSPCLDVEAVVVAKREDLTRHDMPVAGDASGAHGFHHTTSTNYYATFEVKSGDRLEFSVPGEEYGLLVEGDRGELRFQGTRYLGFSREV